MRTSEWLPLAKTRIEAKRTHAHEQLRTAGHVYNGIRERRKQYLGTDLSLEAIVRPYGRVDYDNIHRLTNFLSSSADAFYRKDYPNNNYFDTFENFFYYALVMYGEHHTYQECFDDLILLAECYESDREVYRMVMSDNLPAEQELDMQEWVEDTEQIPFRFSRYVTAAVASLLGVLPSCA